MIPLPTGVFLFRFLFKKKEKILVFLISLNRSEIEGEKVTTMADGVERGRGRKTLEASHKSSAGGADAVEVGIPGRHCPHMCACVLFFFESTHAHDSTWPPAPTHT